LNPGLLASKIVLDPLLVAAASAFSRKAFSSTIAVAPIDTSTLPAESQDLIASQPDRILADPTTKVHRNFHPFQSG
jgi:hypothetical protein